MNYSPKTNTITIYLEDALSMSFQILAANCYAKSLHIKVNARKHESGFDEITIHPANTGMVQRLRNDWKILLATIQGNIQLENEAAMYDRLVGLEKKYNEMINDLTTL